MKDTILINFNVDQYPFFVENMTAMVVASTADTPTTTLSKESVKIPTV
jgi:hypothetical protein